MPSETGLLDAGWGAGGPDGGAPGPAILVVEDDIDTQANLRDILELDGYRVEAAALVQQALERTNWEEYTAIILDRRLPDGTAEDLLPRLKALAPEASVIVLTGYGDFDSTVTALRHGVTDYRLKPINPDALRARLAQIARLKEAERRSQQAERLAAIGQMITALSHESGNALARAQACLEMLALEVADRPEALELIGRIQRAQEDLRQLYEEVRNYAAPLKLEREPWGLNIVWRQAWANLAVRRQDRDASLSEECAGMDLGCAIDPFRLEQVFRNILENSLAACRDPVRIEIRCAEAEIEGRPAVRVAVRDNGPGLTPEQRRRIFEPFFTTKAKGTGLGMAIARRIVEAHGGRIAVGEGGPGAEVVITVPREPS